MDELEQRVTAGLRKIVDGAPVDADIWSETARAVDRRRHRRLTATVTGLVVAGGLAVGLATLLPRPAHDVRVVAPVPSPTRPASTTMPTTTTEAPTSTTEVTTTTTTTPVPDLGRFVGDWFGHGSLVTVDANGNGTAVWRTYRWCNDHSPPCDTIDANGLITSGGHGAFRITSTSGATATAEVRSSTDPSAVPVGFVVIRLTSGGQLEFGRLLACGPRAASNACGA